MTPTPLVILNVVGLTQHLLPHAPRLSKFAASGKAAPMRGVFPAVTASAQASMLTGVSPGEHGIVGNGWFWRETGEVRFWLQANALMQRPPLYQLAREEAARRGAAFTCAKLFWWFNQGAAVDWSLTPKPHYGADGGKAFDVYGTPSGFANEIKAELGPFPFAGFWGPRAGIESSRWIAQAAALTIERKRPSLTLVYLPHLDYDLQRLGADGAVAGRAVGEVDECAGAVLDAARRANARVLVVSEYGLRSVSRPVHLNRVLRVAGLLAVRDGPYGETLDTFASRAFAVCDHQCAHVYVRDMVDAPAVFELLASQRGVARVLERDEFGEIGADHPRSGDLVLMSEPDAWFAYPWWLDDARAPDFARTVDIHRKPGYDPCELLIDPAIRWPALRVASRLLRKKLGMRYLMDVVPLDAALVKGSHGLLDVEPERGPLILADAETAGHLPPGPALTDVRDIALRAMGLACRRLIE